MLKRLFFLTCPPLFVLWTCVCAESFQSCLTLCNAMNCILLGSSVHGIFQAGILEWVDISFSRASSQPRDWTCPSCIGRQILYHWNTWETQHVRLTLIRHGFDPWFRKIPWNRKWQRVRKAKFSVQGWGLCPFTVGGMGSIPGQGTKILHVLSRSQFFCDLVDCNLLGSSVHGIFQARLL